MQQLKTLEEPKRGFALIVGGVIMGRIRESGGMVLTKGDNLKNMKRKTKKPPARSLRHPAERGGLLCSHPDPLSRTTVAQV